MKLIKLFAISFLMLAGYAHAALEPSVIPDGTFRVDGLPASEESYCSRSAAENRECVPVARTKNGVWIAYWYPGGNGCESGSVGYLNTKTMMDYPITTEADCKVPSLDITFFEQKGELPQYEIWNGEERVQSGLLR